VLALRELQQRFADALFDGADAPIAPHIVEGGIPPALRLAIYRNNLHEGFIKALALAFPVIERLVGEAYFRQLALEFLHAHPSRAGNLHHIGAPLEPFLRQRFAHTEYAYLCDIAALEWAYQEAFIAADAEALSPVALRGIDALGCERVRFGLHPSCGLVRSDYPIVRIWRANRPESQSDEIIDLRSGGDNVLVLRTAECIELHRLSAGELALLSAFARGETLGDAYDAARAADPSFDLGAALGHCVAAGFLTTVLPANGPSAPGPDTTACNDAAPPPSVAPEGRDPNG
jgi:hypothetical protein